MSKIYLDNNATTPLEDEVQEGICAALKEAWGNPSSNHDAGKVAKKVIETARQDVASMLGADHSEIIFTSGGTEADNMIIQSAVDYFNSQAHKHLHTTSHDVQGNSDIHPKGDSYQNGAASTNGHSTNKGRQLPHIISSRMEHPAVNVYLDHLTDTKQAEITYVDLSRQTGCVEVDGVMKAVQSNTILVTVMLANNETGIIQPVKALCHAVKQLHRGPHETARVFIHTDAAQAIGKIPVNVQELGVDYLTVVGHKFYGPRNGAIYARNLEVGDTPLFPMLYGGGQERGYRPGTENTGMIAGLGKASELVIRNLGKYEADMRKSRDYLEQRLLETFPGRVHFNGKFDGSERLPNTCNFSIKGAYLQGDKVLSACKVVQASVGAACHAQNRPSPILLAIGVPEDIAQNALRLSVGRYTSLHDINDVITDLKQAVTALDETV